MVQNKEQVAAVCLFSHGGSVRCYEFTFDGLYVILVSTLLSTVDLGKTLLKFHCKLSGLNIFVEGPRGRSLPLTGAEGEGPLKSVTRQNKRSL